MTTKIKIKPRDQKARAIWETAKQAKEEVARWPAWMRGEDGPRRSASSQDDALQSSPALKAKRFE
ncbi:hypothetical protein G6O69_33915 [Pseudenhygromyxa sp. WMMC2535]|uniref:hypothetical protein n=1 Tax=Pseudenhygromyxa sp. WMMC2535 TaxID=2712867 RepID=UPI0015569D70|nr:hypothetical protein [Pseudenhygromyxa sp. WMMC2535]NVB42867.1 hypothetical protein [Pseudenhygromyxa sp. WMMC2535]